jgi:hypothetical protein
MFPDQKILIVPLLVMSAAVHLPPLLRSHSCVILFLSHFRGSPTHLNHSLLTISVSLLPFLIWFAYSSPFPPFPFVLFELGDNGHSPFGIISQRGEERI